MDTNSEMNIEDLLPKALKESLSEESLQKITEAFNNAVETFPSNIFAGMFGFKKEMMFDLGGQRQTMDKAPEINF